jgi:hypothetical protein
MNRSFHRPTLIAAPAIPPIPIYTAQISKDFVEFHAEDRKLHEYSMGTIFWDGIL